MATRDEREKQKILDAKYHLQHNGFVVHKDNEIRCQVCGKHKSVLQNYFWRSFSPYHQGATARSKSNKRENKGESVTHSFVPICQKCAGDILNNCEIDNVIELLRLMDRPFFAEDWEKVEAEGKIKVIKPITLFGKYLKNIALNHHDKRFKDGELPDSTGGNSNIDLKIKKLTKSKLRDLASFWGVGFDDEEYSFLENEFIRWQETHKSDTQAEKTLLREICVTVLDIRNARNTKSSTKDLKKELQDLMKTAAVDPAKTAAASSGQMQDRYSQWIEDTEKYEPAEYFKDKSLFSDFDGLKQYTDKYIYRPLKNLLTGSRDFDVSDGDE